MTQGNIPKVHKSWPQICTILEDESTIWIESSKFLSTSRLMAVLIILNLLSFLIFRSQELTTSIVIISLLLFAIFAFYRKRRPIEPVVSYRKSDGTFYFETAKRTLRKNQIKYAEVRSIPPVFYNRKTFVFSILPYESEEAIFIFDWQSERDEPLGSSPVQQMREIAQEFSTLVGIELKDSLPSHYN